MQSQVVELLVIDSSGCEQGASASITVSAGSGIFIPNIFTPDNDGVNDVFRPLASDRNILIHRFAVFNRWGGVVYSARELRIPNIPGWNGRIKGKDAETGVYVYSLEAEYQDGHIVQLGGDVTLVR